MATPTYTIPMGTLFSKQANSDTNYGDMNAESLRIKQDEQRRAEMARQQALEIINRDPVNPNLDGFVLPVIENFTTPDAEPYSQLTARQAPPSIVGGMFSPEISRAAEMEYMQRRQAAMQNEAMAYAQLTPMQQAQFGFYRGGQQLGDVLGGALGGKDPQLQMIGLQQQILSELDPSDPEQQLRVAQKYAKSAPDLAMKIAESARKSMSEMALTTQRLREKQGADPFEQLLRTGKYTPASMATYKVSQNVADLREVDSPDKVPADIQKARLVAQGKGFKEGTKEYNDEIVKQLEKTDKERNIAAPLQVANRIAEITKLQATLDPQSQDYKTLEIEKSQLQRPEKPVAVAPALQVAERLRQISVAQRNLTKDSPEFQDLEIEKVQLQKVEKTEATPAKIQEAQTVARNKGFIEGTPQFNAEVVNYLERPETETQIQQLQNYRKKLQDSNASASDIAEVNAAIKALAEGNAPKIIMPGQQVAPKDWLAFSSQISKDPVMDRTSIIISDAPNAIETIRMSTSNDIAAASLPGALARLTGEGKNMSDRDILRYARTGGLDDRVAQDVVGFFTGRKTTVTKEQAERFATAVYRGALLERKKFIKDQAEQAGYDKTPNYDIAIRQLDDQLAKFKLIKPNDKSTSNQNLDADSLVNKYLQPK